MRSNLERNHVRHQQMVIVSVETEPVPRIAETEWLTVDELGYDLGSILHVTARFGYMDIPDVPEALRMLEPEQTEGRRLDLDGAVYFLSTIQLKAGKEPTMATWRKHLFIATAHITADAADHFRLPRDRIVTVGSHIEV